MYYYQYNENGAITAVVQTDGEIVRSNQFITGANPLPFNVAGMFFDVVTSEIYSKDEEGDVIPESVVDISEYIVE